MHPVLILLVGVAVVIGGVLVLRLHAFLALVLAALIVGVLTPYAAREQFLLERAAFDVSTTAPQGIDEQGDRLVYMRNGASRISTTYLFVLAPDESTGRYDKVGQIEVTGKEKGHAFGESDVEIGPHDLVVSPSDWKASQAAAGKTVGERVAAAFGNTCSKIGILIAMAAIIGKCLLDSGAADRIVRAAMKVMGERGAPLAFVGSGFLLGVPVFFDTVFYLMMPLGKALRMRTGRNYLLYILTIVAGASMAHSLVPPTPGPLLVAGELGIDLGLMIIAGCCVGAFSSTAAMLYAHWVNGRAEVPLRESSDFSLEDLEKLSKRDESELPALWLSLLPIVLPVILIAGLTVLNTLSKSGIEISPDLMYAAKTLGNKNIALAIATVIAMTMLIRQTGRSFSELGEACSGALASGGVIILITAAGGAFGGMLQQTGVTSLIRDLNQYSSAVVITLAFLITTGIRTAQGSATVAMITAVGILAGFADPAKLGCHPVYLALAIGCGSKPIAWMNDSGFWVICKMSGMTEAEGLRFVTPMSILMGLVGLLATLAGATLFPLAG